MTSRTTTPARLIARRECALHAVLCRHAREGNRSAFEASRHQLEGWSRLRAFLAADEPHSAWLN